MDANFSTYCSAKLPEEHGSAVQGDITVLHTRVLLGMVPAANTNQPRRFRMSHSNLWADSKAPKPSVFSTVGRAEWPVCYFSVLALQCQKAGLKEYCLHMVNYLESSDDQENVQRCQGQCWIDSVTQRHKHGLVIFSSVTTRIIYL
jgi:hypothetical protein